MLLCFTVLFSFRHSFDFISVIGNFVVGFTVFQNNAQRKGLGEGGETLAQKPK